MPWPPASLPANRTNATPQTNTHPNDHNAIAQAVNDTVAKVESLDAFANSTAAYAEVIDDRVDKIVAGVTTVGKSTLSYKVRSVDTANDIEFHWDPPSLYFRIDGGEWFPIDTTP